MNLFEVLAILMLIVGFVIGAVTAFEDSNFNHGARYMMRWERVTAVSDKRLMSTCAGRWPRDAKALSASTSRNPTSDAACSAAIRSFSLSSSSDTNATERSAFAASDLYSCFCANRNASFAQKSARISAAHLLAALRVLFLPHGATGIDPHEARLSGFYLPPLM